MFEQPTSAMVKDGLDRIYESATGKKYSRVQLLTVEGLLDGTQRAEHPDYEPESERDWRSSRKPKPPPLIDEGGRGAGERALAGEIRPFHLQA